jgi:hypothetical protein
VIQLIVDIAIWVLIPCSLWFSDWRATAGVSAALVVQSALNALAGDSLGCGYNSLLAAVWALLAWYEYRNGGGRGKRRRKKAVELGYKALAKLRSLKRSMPKPTPAPRWVPEGSPALC